MESNTYNIDLPVFSGPLELLLHLIEHNELDITAISLAAVTEQYLAQIDLIREDKVEHLVDFVVIGARLLVIKSRALLPHSPSTLPEESEEDPAETLARQLRRYKQFKESATWLGDREGRRLRSYLRVAPAMKAESRLDLGGITVATLSAALESALVRADMMEDSVSVAVSRSAFTIEKQIDLLRSHLDSSGRIFFEELLSDHVTWQEVSITLLAVLELIKRHEANARQPVLFGPIEIVADYERQRVARAS